MAETTPLTSTSYTPIVEQLVSTQLGKQRAPVDRLEERRDKLESKSTALTDVKTKFKTLRTRLSEFTAVGASAKLQAKQAVSSDESIFTVEADSSASMGVHTIAVSRIARNDLAITDKFNSSGSNLASNLGDSVTFSIQIGSGDVQQITVSIDESDTNEDILDKIAASISTNAEDVTATVIASSKNTVRLSIVAEESGSDNTLAITAEEDMVSALETLGFFGNNSTERREFTNNSGGFITDDTDDLDALVAVDGIEITSSTNTITDVIQGVTITLRKAQDDDSQPETFSIIQDTEEIVSLVEDFIADYNEALTKLSDEMKINTDDDTRGELAGDFIYTNLRLNIRSTVSAVFEDAEEGAPALLSEIGIEIGDDGTLSIDDMDELEDAIEEDPEVIIELFSGTNGLANRLDDVIEQFTITGGTIDRNISSAASQKESVESQISQYESRLKIVEANLRAKYTELERTLTLLNSQQALLERLGFSAYSTDQYSISGQTNQTSLS